MEEQEKYSTREPAPLPPMVAGVKQEILSLASNITGDNYRPMLAEIGRIADWWLGELTLGDLIEEEGDGNDTE